MFCRCSLMLLIMLGSFPWTGSRITSFCIRVFLFEESLHLVERFGVWKNVILLRPSLFIFSQKLGRELNHHKISVNGRELVSHSKFCKHCHIIFHMDTLFIFIFFPFFLFTKFLLCISWTFFETNKQKR